jgi:hypothetical protein
MILLQAVPPVPPMPPHFVSNADGPAIVMMTLLVMTAVTIVLWPIARALARRLEGRGTADTALRAEMEQLHHRLGEMDLMQGRIAELEERLDFAERLLAQSRETDRLQQ